MAGNAQGKRCQIDICVRESLFHFLLKLQSRLLVVRMGDRKVAVFALTVMKSLIQLFLDRIHHQCLRLLHRAGLCKGIQLFSQDNQDRLDP